MLRTQLIFIMFLIPLVMNSQNPLPLYGDNAAAGHTIVLNGVKHYYEVYGEGAPMLLIHGNGTATKGMGPQIEYFSKKYKVYSVDCRGRGKSELGPDSLTYTGMARDLAQFIQKLKLDSVVIIGKSDGGIIALLLGIYHPDRIKRIVAFGANADPGPAVFFERSLTELHNDRVHAEKMMALGDTTKNWKLEQQKLRLMEFQPHIKYQELRKIEVPVLVVSCDRDLIREEHTLFIYKSIKKANLCILPGERHGVPRLNPALFNSMVDNYLSKPYKGEEFRFEK